jgi:hypothetical protein
MGARQSVGRSSPGHVLCARAAHHLTCPRRSLAGYPPRWSWCSGDRSPPPSGWPQARRARGRAPRGGGSAPPARRRRAAGRTSDRPVRHGGKLSGSRHHAQPARRTSTSALTISCSGATPGAVRAGALAATAAPAPPISCRSDHSHSEGPRGNAAAGWSGSTSGRSSKVSQPGRITTRPGHLPAIAIMPHAFRDSLLEIVVKPMPSIAFRPFVEIVPRGVV